MPDKQFMCVEKRILDEYSVSSFGMVLCSLLTYRACFICAYKAGFTVG